MVKFYMFHEYAVSNKSSLFWINFQMENTILYFEILSRFNITSITEYNLITEGVIAEGIQSKFEFHFFSNRHLGIQI